MQVRVESATDTNRQMIPVTDVARIGVCSVIAALAGAISGLVTTQHAYGFIGGVVAMVVLLHMTTRGSVDHKDGDRSPLFAGIVLALAIASMLVLTVAGWTLIGYGVLALLHWIAA
jgi:hypothetical protein